MKRRDFLKGAAASALAVLTTNRPSRDTKNMV